MALDIKPNRSELIKLKKRIKLAKSGYNLLKRKRDGLIMEFFEVLKQAKTVRADLVAQYQQATVQINLARTVESDAVVQSLAWAVQQNPEIIVRTKNIMGVVVPKIEAGTVQKDLLARGDAITSSTAAIDAAASAYERTVEHAIKAAEVETTMKKLLAEIEKAKRRVHALEFKVIPELDAKRKQIALRLEEMEREGTFRMKRVKG